MKKVIFSLMMLLMVLGAVSLNSCTKSKTDIVNELVDEAKTELAKANQQGLQFDVRNENDDFVMEISSPEKFTSEDIERVNSISDADIAAAAKQNFKTTSIKILKDWDIKIRYIFKDAAGQKIEKVLNPALL